MDQELSPVALGQPLVAPQHDIDSSPAAIDQLLAIARNQAAEAGHSNGTIEMAVNLAHTLCLLFGQNSAITIHRLDKQNAYHQRVINSLQQHFYLSYDKTKVMSSDSLSHQEIQQSVDNSTQTIKTSLIDSLKDKLEANNAEIKTCTDQTAHQAAMVEYCQQKRLDKSLLTDTFIAAMYGIMFTACTAHMQVLASEQATRDMTHNNKRSLSTNSGQGTIAVSSISSSTSDTHIHSHRTQEKWWQRPPQSQPGPWTLTSLTSAITPRYSIPLPFPITNRGVYNIDTPAS